MPALFVFLLKVNIALLLFCAGYYLVLRHLTFYTLNRIYLVTAILFASAYPQINLSEFVQQHQQIAKPVQAVVFNLQSPAEIFIKPFSQPNYWYWVEVVFWAGAALLALRLLTQLYSLYKLYRNSTESKIYDHNVRLMSGDSGPFSFWKSIYVNPSNHEPAELKAILLHEEVHVSELHTLDILLAELSTIFYWFNPGVWLIKKAVRENIEFITDRKILGKGVDTKTYQYSLINVSFSAKSNPIVNHFNISTIKKRIIMMNAKRSSKANLTRYAFLVPAVVAMLLVFSISKAAFLKKTTSAYKAVTVTIKTGNTTISKGLASITKSDVTNNKTNLNNIAKLSNGKINDTVKNGNFYLTTSQPSDSLNYVINGVKATKADFKAIDPDNIYSVEMMPAEKASKIIDKIDNNYNVLFVTTDNSEAGKKFKEKIDKLNNIDAVNGNIITIGKGTVMPGIKGKIASTLSSDEGPGNSIVTNSTSSGSGTLVYTTVRPKLKTIKFKTHSKNGLDYVTDSLTMTQNGDPIVLKLNGNDTLIYNNYTISSKNKALTIKPKLATKSFYKYNVAYSSKPYTTIYSSNINQESNIEHISAKMIMIDGKEATENDLKKISAADIESMSVKSGDEVAEKYGDKAKDGVVFITTKKARK